jgi:hypothetical protein
MNTGFHTVGDGGGGIYPRHKFDMEVYPPINLFFGNFWGFENLINLSVILRHLEAITSGVIALFVYSILAPW